MWKAFVDGSNNFKGFSISVIIMDNEQNIHEYSVYISFPMKNDVAKYEAAIFLVITARKLGAHIFISFNNLRLVIN